MKEYGKQKSHISSKLNVIYKSSNNVRYPVTETHYTSPNYNSPNYTSPHFTTLVGTSLPPI